MLMMVFVMMFCMLMLVFVMMLMLTTHNSYNDDVPYLYSFFNFTLQRYGTFTATRLQTELFGEKLVEEGIKCRIFTYYNLHKPAFRVDNNLCRETLDSILLTQRL